MSHTELAAAVNGRVEDHVVVQERLASKYLEPEKQLFETKWFDYRLMTPKGATDQFAEAYGVIYRRKYAANFDRTRAALKKGLLNEGVYASQRELAGIWGARQFADRLGLPYDLFISWAMEGCLRSGSKKIPRPNQLYGSKGELIANHVRSTWSDHCREARFMFSALPIYRVNAYCGFSAQDARYDWIIEQVRVRHAKPWILAKVCFDEQVLPIARAVSEFGEAAIDRARVEAPEVSAPRTKLVVSDLLPGCFALPDRAGPLCGKCRVRSNCSDNAARVSSEVIARTGTEHPVDHRHRKAGRDRLRRLRVRRRLGAAT